MKKTIASLLISIAFTAGSMPAQAQSEASAALSLLPVASVVG